MFNTTYLHFYQSICLFFMHSVFNKSVFRNSVLYLKMLDIIINSCYNIRILAMVKYIESYNRCSFLLDILFVGHVLHHILFSSHHIQFGFYLNNFFSVKCYYDLSKRLGKALRHEEKRCSYLTEEMKIMVHCIF